jgi:membrane-associated phospholipid phosphatase
MAILNLYFTKPTVRFSTLLVLFVGVLAPLYLFGLLADDVMEHHVFFFDKPILVFLHSHASPGLDTVMRFFTHAGSALVLVPFNGAVLALLMWRRSRWIAAFWVLAVAGAALLNGLAKQIFARSRPDLWVSSLPETTFSFPSGHGMQSMAVIAALTVMMWRTHWRWHVLAFGSVFVLLVGISRVYWVCITLPTFWRVGQHHLGGSSG